MAEHMDHISKQFNEELHEARNKMLEMGGLVEQQVSKAITAIMSRDSELAIEVIESDKKVNDMEMLIDEECMLILARRQPAATDLRMVLTILRAVHDLERMGDEACKVAKAAEKLSSLGGIGRSYLEIKHIGEHVTRMVHDSLDAFARLDSQQAIAVAEEDRSVDLEYGTAMRSLVTYMMEDPRSISAVQEVLWSLRSLERVGDHANNIAEHVIYLVKGWDVRHTSVAEVVERLNK